MMGESEVILCAGDRDGLACGEDAEGTIELKDEKLDVSGLSVRMIRSRRPGAGLQGAVEGENWVP